MQLEEKSISQAYPNFKNKWGSFNYKNHVNCLELAVYAQIMHF